MEIKVTQFQIHEGWLYVLFDDGTMNRKYIKDLHTADWEVVDLPVEEELVVSKQAVSGAKKKILVSEL